MEHKIRSCVLTVLLVSLPVISIGWVTNVPIIIGLAITSSQFLLGFLALLLAAAFLNKPYTNVAPWVTDLLALISFVTWGFAAVYVEDWMSDFGLPAPEKWVSGVIGILLLMETLRRYVGLIITIVVCVFLLYAFVGPYLPMPLTTAPSDARRTVMYFYADYNGVPGMILDIAATLVVAFMVFSRTLSVTRATEFFDLFATALFGRFRGGAGKIAVVSSAMFGLISGDTISNIMTSGSMSIPLMKKSGFPAARAAAIEAVASNAGQITPPIMGATAFLIAQFLKIPYAEVALAAAFPALVIYVTLFVQINSYAARMNIKSVTPTEPFSYYRFFRTGLPFLVAMTCLIYLIFGKGTHLAVAALQSALLTLLLHLLLERGRDAIGIVYRILRGAAEDVLSVLIIAAAAGILVGSLNFTGIGFRVTMWLGAIAEHAGLLPMLMLTAVLCIFMGMGMPTAAIYILLSVLLGPGIVNAGVDPLAAHLFIFFFGLLSMLTPPVAFASYTAAGLAGAKFGATSAIAVRLGSVAYLLPFLFVYEPAVIGRSGLMPFLETAVPVLLNIVILGWGFDGALAGRPFRHFAFRFIIIGLALCGCVVSIKVFLGGIVIAVAAFATAYLLSAPKKDSPSLADAPR